MEIRAKKDLISDTGVKDFTKGKTYVASGTFEKITENTKVMDDQGELHQLGNWARHFTKVN